MPEIILENINKRFGDFTAVENLNLVIPDKSFVCFLGPSGCGKTTTLRMITGLEEPTSGRIYIGGELVYCSKREIWTGPEARGVGLIFQSYALWPHMTVFDNIGFGLQMKRMRKDSIAARVGEVATWVQIDHLLGRYPSELSGGQQQRVALARSLAPEPSAMLMDEPLSNLDAKLRIEMRSELKRIHTRTEQTIIYVTHDQLEALSLGSHVAVMSDGRLQQVADPIDIYRYPNNLFVAGFVGMPPINVIDGVAERDRRTLLLRKGRSVFSIRSTEEIVEGQQVSIGVRPEDIVLHSGQENIGWPFKIYSNQPAGSEAVVQIVNDDDLLLTSKVTTAELLPPDTEVRVTFREDRLLVFDTQSGQRIDTTVSVAAENSREPVPSAKHG